MNTPTPGQIALVIVSIAFFVIGGGISLSRIRIDRSWSRIAAKACMYFGLTFALIAVISHSVARGSWLPLEDNFDTLIWLAVILSAFVMYVQRRRPLGGLDWFVMPVVVLLMIGAAIIGLTNPREYEVRGLWSWVHLAGTYGGSAAFAIAAAAGTMYLVANYRLRNKLAMAGPNLGSLERLERLTMESVSVGFALLTIGAIIGFMKMHMDNRHATTVLILSIAVWLVYAVVLHAPINPNFRGRRAAVLSIVGFVLMLGAVVAELLSARG